MTEKLERRREINKKLNEIDGQLLVAKIMKASSIEDELYEQKRVLLSERTKTY